MSKYIIALDQGTTSSRCIIFDYYGKIAAKAQKEITQIFPKPGWVEHDPMEIYKTQLEVISEAIKASNAKMDEFVAIGITNQRETTVVWNKETGKPIYNAIVWQCRRTAKMIDKLNEDGLKQKVIETTALGAAYLAGLAIGFWKSKEEIKNNWLLNKEFKPVIDNTQRDQLLTNWHKAIRLALLWKDI